MDATRDSHTKWSKSERERQIPYDFTYIWNLIYSTNEPFHRKENHRHGEQTCGCQERGRGSRGSGNFGLIDANHCLWNGWAMRSCCIAQGTVSSHLWYYMVEDNVRKITYIYDWVTLLYSWNW